LGYQLGDKIVLAHGIAEVSLAKHDDSPFVITGILAPTGAPVDNSLYISLAGMAAIHEDWQSGVKFPSPKKQLQQSAQKNVEHDEHEHEHEHEHATVCAAALRRANPALWISRGLLVSARHNNHQDQGVEEFL